MQTDRRNKKDQEIKVRNKKRNSVRSTARLRAAGLLLGAAALFLVQPVMSPAWAQDKVWTMAPAVMPRVVLPRTQDEIQQQIDDILPGIVCWGDSLTEGTEGDGITWPDTLEKRIDKELIQPIERKYDMDLVTPRVYNMGVAGETSLSIAGRSGAIPFVLKEGLRIPADPEPVEISFVSSWDGKGYRALPLCREGTGIDYVILGGIRGHLEPRNIDDRTHYFFIREEAGSPVTVPAGQQLITQGTRDYQEDWMVALMGENGTYDSDLDLVRQNQAMIDHQTRHQDKSLIVGIKLGNVLTQGPQEELMNRAFGDKYINLREYMATDALRDADILPTGADLRAIFEGSMPPSMMVSDGRHFHGFGYAQIGDLIYERMDALGWFEPLKELGR